MSYITLLLDSENYIFADYGNVLRVFLNSILSFIIIIAIVQLYGKRSTSAFNTFDWIVTVAMGSIMSSMILLNNVTVVDGGVAIVFLIGLQYLISYLNDKSDKFKRLIKSKPVILFLDGKILEDNLKKEKVLKEDVVFAIRKEGLANFSEVYAVILENNASLSVIERNDAENYLTLYNVEGFPEDKNLDFTRMEGYECLK